MLILLLVPALAVTLVAASHQLARALPAATNDRDRTGWGILAVLAAGALVAVMGLRDVRVGTDTPMYYSLYSMLEPTFWREEIAASPQEVGYTALSLLLRSVTDHPHVIFWVAAVLTVVPVMARLLREGRSAWFALALFVMLGYYVTPMNALRQGIAVALLFYAEDHLHQRRWGRYALLAAVASTFHISAVIAIALQVVVVVVRPSLRLAATTGAVAALVGVAAAELPFLDYLLGSLNDRYVGYLTREEAGVGTYLAILFKIGLIVYSVWLARRSDDPGRYATYQTYLVLAVLFMVLGTEAVDIARMETYFGIFAAVLFARQTADLPSRVLHRALLAVSGVGYFVMHLVSYNEVLPYQTYLT